MKHPRILPFFLLLITLCGGCELFDNDGNESDEPCLINCGDPFFVIDSEPAWSPDGTTIAYVGADTAGELGIYLINPDGSGKKLFHTGNVGAPSWSPDNKWIVFHENGQILKKHLPNDSLVQLTFEGRNFFPDWSPDGEWIVYGQSICQESKQCGIWIYNLESEKEHHVAQYGQYPSWHPFNSTFLYQTRVITMDGEAIGDSLWFHDVSIRNNQPLAYLSGNNSYPKYSKSGNEILFTSQPYTTVPNIYVLNVAKNSISQLTETGAYTADWSPDGGWIVYTETSETGRLWLMRADGSQKKQVTGTN